MSLDFGGFNVFSLLSTKSNVKINVKELTDAAPIFIVPARVSEVSIFMAAGAGSGGSSAAGGGGGGAGGTLWIPRMPVFPGVNLNCIRWDGVTWRQGPGRGGGSVINANGNGGQATGLITTPGIPFTIFSAENFLICSAGGFGGSSGVGGTAGGNTNIKSGGGPAGGAVNNNGVSVDTITEFFEKLNDSIIRISGASGSGRSSGPQLRGGNVMALGGQVFLPVPSGGGGGASLFGTGGRGGNTVDGGGGVAAGGGGGSLAAFNTGAGGNGFCFIFWKGRKE